MYRERRYLKLLFLAVLFLRLTGLTPLLAQEEIRKEVRVVKPYEPVLEKARKINPLPQIDDTARYRPAFTYSITPKPYLAPYEARPIRAARLEGESIPRLYKSYLRLGFGNYVTPEGELNINSLRSDDHNMGLYIGHRSSRGKVKLDNGTRVKAPYSHSKGEWYGQKYFKHSTLDAKAFITSDRFSRYGYYPVLDTVLVPDSIEQNYLNPGVSLGYASAWPDSGHLNYAFVGKYDFFSAGGENLQHAVRFRGSMDTQFQDKTIGIASNIRYFQRNNSADTANNTVVSLQPWFRQSTSEWRLKAALDATFDVRNGNTEIRLYPKIRFQFNIVPDFVTAYIGMDGGLETNDLLTLARENPYINPGLRVYNTDRKMEVYGSLFGQTGKNSDYRLFASFTLADQMPFFVNDSSNGLGNRFTVVYDDVQIFSVQGEYGFRLGRKWDVTAKAGLYRYTMSSIRKPWQKPGFDASLRVGYNLQDKILIRTDLLYTGSRYAVSLDRMADMIELPGFPDLNLELEYRYTKILSFYLRMNNIAGGRYQIWNQYPVQGFRLMAGFSYSL